MQDIILDNQDKVDSLIIKKIKLNTEQLKKLEMMKTYYHYNKNKVEASSLIVGEALEYYFQNKYVEDLTKLK